MEEPAPEPVPDGVDETIVQWMASLTPAERLRLVDECAAEILRIRKLNGRG